MRGKIELRSDRDSWNRYWRVLHRLDPSARAPEDAYVDRVLQQAKGGRWLDAGCGRQSFPPWRSGEFEALDATTLGCDLDRSALHESVELGRVCAATLERLPFPDGCFDLVTSNMVFEHLDEPDTVVAELVRVAAPGGRVLIHTVNALHYEAWIAHWTPLWFHRWVVMRLQGRRPEDTYPTRYRANTGRRLAELFARRGWRVSYGGAVRGIPVHAPYPVLFWLALGWGLVERLLARLPVLGALWRPNLLMEFQRSDPARP